MCSIETCTIIQDPVLWWHAEARLQRENNYTLVLCVCFLGYYRNMAAQRGGRGLAPPIDITDNLLGNTNTTIFCFKWKHNYEHHIQFKSPWIPYDELYDRLHRTSIFADNFCLFGKCWNQYFKIMVFCSRGEKNLMTELLRCILLKNLHLLNSTLLKPFYQQI